MLKQKQRQVKQQTLDNHLFKMSFFVPIIFCRHIKPYPSTSGVYPDFSLFSELWFFYGLQKYD